MDNNLIELSKPVAYTDADELRFNHATSDMWPIPLGFGKDAPLYSQEYVLALLAELEAKDKRIEELGRANKSQDDHINQQQDRIDSLEKTNAGLGRGLAAAEKRWPYRCGCRPHPVALAWRTRG